MNPINRLIMRERCMLLCTVNIMLNIKSDHPKRFTLIIPHKHGSNKRERIKHHCLIHIMSFIPKMRHEGGHRGNELTDEMLSLNVRIKSCNSESSVDRICKIMGSCHKEVV